MEKEIIVTIKVSGEKISNCGDEAAETLHRLADRFRVIGLFNEDIFDEKYNYVGDVQIKDISE